MKAPKREVLGTPQEAPARPPQAGQLRAATRPNCLLACSSYRTWTTRRNPTNPNPIAQTKCRWRPTPQRQRPTTPATKLCLGRQNSWGRVRLLPLRLRRSHVAIHAKTASSPTSEGRAPRPRSPETQKLPKKAVARGQPQLPAPPQPVLPQSSQRHPTPVAPPRTSRLHGAQHVASPVPHANQAGGFVSERCTLGTTAPGKIREAHRRISSSWLSTNVEISGSFYTFSPWTIQQNQGPKTHSTITSIQSAWLSGSLASPCISTWTCWMWGCGDLGAGRSQAPWVSKKKKSSNDFAILFGPDTKHLAASLGAGVLRLARFRVLHPKAKRASWVSHRADAQGVPRRGIQLTLPTEDGGHDFIGLCNDATQKSAALDSGGNRA